MSDRIYLRADERTLELPRGSLHHEEPADTAQATRLDLRGTRLAFDWFYFREQCRTPPPDPQIKIDNPRAQRQIWFVDTRRTRRLIDTGCSDDQNQVGDASLDSGGLRYQHDRPGPPYENRGGTQSSVLLTVNERGKRLGTRPLPDGIVASAANDKILVTSRFVAAAPGSVDGTYELAIEPQQGPG